MENCRRNPWQKAMARTFTLGECLGWWSVTLLIGIMGAHFYRSSEYGIVLCAVGMLMFHFTSSAWKSYAIAFFLFWGAFEWASTAHLLAFTRMRMNMPWMRGSLILFVVGAVTALGGVYAAARGKALKEKSKQDPRSAGRDDHALFQGVVFIAVFLLLFLIRQKSPINLLLLERFAPALGAVQIFFASWYAAFVAGKLINPRTSRKTRRRIWLLFAAVFFVQFGLGLLGVDRMLMTGKLHVPIPGFIVFAPVFRGDMSMMPILAGIAVLLAGGAWCSTLCYFGGFDSLAAGKGPVRPAPAWLGTAMRYGRPFVLLAGIAVALALRAAGIQSYTAVGAALAFAALSLGIMLFVSRRYSGMAHCTAFCPFGLLVSLLAKASPWRMRVSRDCNHCSACEKVCLYRAIDRESREKGVTRARCSMCRDCVGVCAKKAVTVHATLLPQSCAHLAEPILVGIVTVLHTVFLTVARV